MTTADCSLYLFGEKLYFTFQDTLEDASSAKEILSLPDIIKEGKLDIEKFLFFFMNGEYSIYKSYYKYLAVEEGLEENEIIAYFKYVYENFFTNEDFNFIPYPYPLNDENICNRLLENEWEYRDKLGFLKKGTKEAVIPLILKKGTSI